MPDQPIEDGRGLNCGRVNRVGVRRGRGVRLRTVDIVLRACTFSPAVQLGINHEFRAALPQCGFSRLVPGGRDRNGSRRVYPVGSLQTDKVLDYSI